jgi:flagellar biosynthesis/type III secretory pathway protein FliH
MKRAIAWLKNSRPLKILIVFLAGTLLVLTQACNRPGIAAQPPQPASQPPNAARYDPTKDYPLSTYEGGMNNFSDVDPRAKAAEKAAETKAKILIETAERNIQEKGIDSREQYVKNYQQGTPFGERVNNLGEDVRSSAAELQQGVAEGTQRGIENLQQNTRNAAEGLTQKVQRAAEDTGKNAQRTAEDAAEALRRTVREAD